MENAIAKLVFKSAFAGKSKAGNPFKMVTFYQLLKDKDDKPYTSELTFFVDEIPANVSALLFGDVCEVELHQSDNFSRPPEFVAVKRVLRNSPYFKDGAVSL